jgi:hypothetical protein
VFWSGLGDRRLSPPGCQAYAHGADRLYYYYYYYYYYRQRQWATDRTMDLRMGKVLVASSVAELRRGHPVRAITARTGPDEGVAKAGM